LGSRNAKEAPKTLTTSAVKTPFFIPRGPSCIRPFDSSFVNTVNDSAHPRKRKLGSATGNYCVADGLQHAIYIAGCSKAMPVIVLPACRTSLGCVIATSTHMPHVIHLLASKTQNLACGVLDSCKRVSCTRNTLNYFEQQSVLAIDKELQVLSLGCSESIIGVCTLKLLFEFASIEIHSQRTAGVTQALLHRILHLHGQLVPQWPHFDSQIQQTRNAQLGVIAKLSSLFQHNSCLLRIYQGAAL